MLKHFDHSIANVQGQADVLIQGNANFEGNSEPGIVMVSKDENGNGLPDDTWYELKGSADADSVGKVIYGYTITYQRPATEDADGKKYDIEIQKGKAGELPQRARYYSSVLDARTSLKKNETFDRLPDSFIIFICSYDIMSADTAMKWYRRICLDTGEE